MGKVTDDIRKMHTIRRWLSEDEGLPEKVRLPPEAKKMLSEELERLELLYDDLNKDGGDNE